MAFLVEAAASRAAVVSAEVSLAEAVRAAASRAVIRAGAAPAPVRGEVRPRDTMARVPVALACSVVPMSR